VKSLENQPEKDSNSASPTETGAIVEKIESGKVKVNEKGANKLTQKKGKAKTKNFFKIDCEINKWGDIHFKKAMLEELAKISGIEKGTPLVMSFKKGGIEISKK